MVHEHMGDGAGRTARRPPRGPESRILGRGVAVVGLVIAVAASCADADAVPSADVAPFPGSATSLEGLGERVLLGLTTGDPMSLAELRLTEREHNEVLWPELPASDPALNVPLDYAWNDIEVRNRAALDRIAGWYHGRGVRLGGVECEGAPEQFETFRVLTDCWLEFETELDRERTDDDGLGDESRGDERLDDASLDDRRTESDGRFRAQLFKDVVERGGGYKVFRYYDELPERVDGW